MHTPFIWKKYKIMPALQTFLFILILSSIISLVKSSDSFTEELFIKPLANGRVYSYFQFTTIWDVETEQNPYNNCHLFPRGLGEIVGRYNVEELHISLTHGIWRHNNWGYPVLDAPPGAELWVWFKNDTKNIDETWKLLTSSLSGLLCASLNFIDTSNTMAPEYSFRPRGIIKENASRRLLRYATLPQEIVCTENLTPWKKLLPCDSKRGLATLLNAGNIYDTNYHSLGIHLRNICRNEQCIQTSIELQQTVSLVHDLVIIDPYSQSFSVKKLYGIGLPGGCSLAEKSMIYFDITSNKTDTKFDLKPAPHRIDLSIRGGYQTELAVYDVKQLGPGLVNIAATYLQPKVFSVIHPPVLTVTRYIVGYGQERGGIVTQLHNRHRQPLDIVFLENIPWFVPIYLHTLKIMCKGQPIVPTEVKYIPGNQRRNPYYLEIVLRLPARAVTEISIDIDYMFLKWQEYPPDANHGFYIGSAIVSTMLPVAKNYTGIPHDVSFIYSSVNATRDGYFLQLRTESLLIVLPTPDFSMPYNVICLACTVVALAFGPLHNITTKRLRAKELTNRSLLSILKGLFNKKSKVEEKEEKNEEKKEKSEEKKEKSEEKEEKSEEKEEKGEEKEEKSEE